jgi:hypothetical protein
MADYVSSSETLPEEDSGDEDDDEETEDDWENEINDFVLGNFDI